MANNYLNSILDVLSAVQARQLSELIQGLQASGAIRDKDEYSKTLAELSQRINDKDPVPSFLPIYSKVWSLCSSDAHNLMMQSIKNDLEAAFIQINEIGEKLEDHHLLYLKNTLADLNKTITTQDTTIKRLGWLFDQNNEFVDALVNTFSSSSLFRVPYSDPKADILFFDNRTSNPITESEISSAIISESNSLTLGEIVPSRINPVAVKLQTDECSYNTERDVDSNSVIENIIDGKENTFWTYNVYLMDPVPEIHIILEFSFGGPKDINYIVIEPATSEAFEIINIDGISSNGDRVNLLYNDVEIKGKTRIDFTRSNVLSLLVTLSCKTSHRAEYFKRLQQDINSDSDRLEETNALSIAIRNTISSSRAADICNVPEVDYEQVNYNVYSFALDNIWFGNSLYRNIGVFVSEPLSIDNIGLLGIYGKEETESEIIRNSIEYDIIKVDTSPKEQEIKIPIPRYNQTHVYSERVIPIKLSQNALLNDIAKTRFLPNLEESVLLYKNGILQALGTDWHFAITDIAQDSSDPTFQWVGDLSQSQYSNFNVAPLGFYIRISNIDSRAVYTIDYTIFHSDTKDSDSVYKTVWLDKAKTISLNKNGLVSFKRDTSYYIKSDIYLQITLRRNKASRSEGPKLFEYAILANKYNE